MKKFLALMLTVVCLVSLLAACGDAKNTTPTDNVTPSPTATPEPTSTPTPTPTPTPDPNCFFKCDFDSKPVGLVADNYEFADALTGDLAYMLFSAVGSGMADFGEGKGVNGSNCLVATGRTANWNGIALNVDEAYFGKGMKISFDAKCESMKEDVTEMNVSLTTKFEIETAPGKASMQYPQYNRIIVTSKDGAWVHGEGVIFFPTDIYVDPENAGTTPQLYFECADGKGKEDILIDNLEITLVDGVGNYEAFQAYWEEHKPAEGE